ncbi:hypothetical protein D3C76_1442030 [compost metagenome]
MIDQGKQAAELGRRDVGRGLKVLAGRKREGHGCASLLLVIVVRVLIAPMAGKSSVWLRRVVGACDRQRYTG